MAVNAQSILETIHENAQKNVLTNKVKRAAVPGLSMFGILWYSSGGSYLAHGADTHNATPQIGYFLMTRVNATVTPIKAALTCEPQLTNPVAANLNFSNISLPSEQIIEEPLQMVKGLQSTKNLPRSYTPRQMEQTILKLLEGWHRRRQQSQER